MNDTMPIADACAALKLSESDTAAVCALVAVRTLGDLRAVLERGEVDAALAKRLQKGLGLR